MAVHRKEICGQVQKMYMALLDLPKALELATSENGGRKQIYQRP